MNVVNDILFVVVVVFQDAHARPKRDHR